MRSFLQDILPVLGATSAEIAAAQDAFNGNPTGDVIRLTDHEELILIVAKLEGATGTGKIQVESCDDFTPTTATEIPFLYRKMTTNGTWGEPTQATAADGVTTTAGANQIYMISVRARDLVEGDLGARVKITEVVDSPVSAFVLGLLVKGRYDSPTPVRSWLS